jgi:hypothetical protein
MACGEEIKTTEGYVTWCWFKISYPCGFKFCQTTISIPYPCGIRWCTGWFGIRYPCGIKICYARFTFSYPCGFKWCDFRIPYLCIKRRPTIKYCYDFQSVRGTCYLFYDDLYGCCDDQEYNWGAACFFATYGDSGPSPGSVGTSAKYYRECFDEPLKPIGPCRPGKSLPPNIGDMPGGPVDSGSVAPHPPSGTEFTWQDQQLWVKKFGRCSRCMVASIILAGFGWLLFLLLPLESFLFPLLFNKIAFCSLAVVLSLPCLGHIIGLISRFHNTIYNQSHSDCRSISNDCF